MNSIFDSMYSIPSSALLFAGLLICIIILFITKQNLTSKTTTTSSSAFTKATYAEFAESTVGVNIDMTKKYHVLTNLNTDGGGFYNVDDGTVDGQELVLIPDYQANPHNIYVYFQTTRLYYEGDLRFNTSSFHVFPFAYGYPDPAVTQSTRTACRCVWIIDSNGGHGTWMGDLETKTFLR